MKHSDAIDNSQDLLDSRDVIARIEELEDERDEYGYEDEDAAENDTDTSSVQAKRDEWAKECPDDADELRALKALAEEAEGYAADWDHGETLIRDSYFKEYAQQLAEDIGAIKADATWPNSCIDWDEAARQLKQDYTSVDFDGVEYWVR